MSGGARALAERDLARPAGIRYGARRRIQRGIGYRFDRHRHPDDLRQAALRAVLLRGASAASATGGERPGHLVCRLLLETKNPQAGWDRLIFGLPPIVTCPATRSAKEPLIWSVIRNN